MENKILHGDSLDLLKDLDDNSVDSIVTDPPYGYSFMGKDWDKTLPSIDIWKECVRVLKPGGFAFIMSAPRSDVHSRMCLMLEEAGFRIDFTPIAWTYATGFPKAMNIGKAVDKREGKERKVVGQRKDILEKQAKDLERGYRKIKDSYDKGAPERNNEFKTVSADITEPASDKAKELDGSYAGYQPKPAWENVIVCMKPLSEKGYLDQAMKDGKGVTWLDDVRIPFQGEDDYPVWWESGSKGSDGYLGTDTFKIRDMSAEEIKSRQFKKSKKKMTDKERYENNRKGFTERSSIKEGEVYSDAYDNPSQKWGFKKPKKTKRKPREENTVFKTSGFKSENNDTAEASPLGRFAANLLVQDDVLGIPSKGAQAPTTGKEPSNYKSNNTHGEYTGHRKALDVRCDEGTFSRYYDLDAWWESRIQELPLDVQATYPFLIVPKASKSEKNRGCEGMEEKYQVNAEYRPNHMEKALECHGGKPHGRFSKVKNNHPTVKPISLMSYLVTLGSREDDLVLDPFVGSGTTCIAAKLLNRKYIGMEMDDGYVVIAQERIKAHKPEVKKHDFF